MMPPADTIPQAFHGFSVPEIVTIWHAAHGMTYQEIAAAMGLSQRTVRHRMGLTFERLKLENRTQLALLALRSGLIRLDDIHIRHGAQRHMEVAQ